jgi:hypothetical protein
MQTDRTWEDIPVVAVPRMVPADAFARGPRSGRMFRIFRIFRCANLRVESIATDLLTGPMRAVDVTSVRIAKDHTRGAFVASVERAATT